MLCNFPNCKISITTCSLNRRKNEIDTVKWLVVYLCVFLRASASSQHRAGLATSVILLLRNVISCVCCAVSL